MTSDDQLLFTRSKDDSTAVLVRHCHTLNYSVLLDDKAVFTERAQYEYTSRGTQRLLHGGYYFSKNKTNESSGRMNWKCQFYQRLRCKARAITKNINGYEYVRVTHEEHTHRQDLTEDEFRRPKRKRDF
ncbi:hypothetical protein RP20_CCG014100 [Aedes albopictus]|nr:hypothetical protein RP20_CCG014100 [Aedes albopictus]